MKPVKNFVFATVLVFSVALTTLGGEIDVPGAPAPQPPPRITTTADDTEVTNTDATEIMATSDYLFLKALAALLSVY